MVIKAALSAAFILSVMAVPSRADFDSGNDLIRFCTSSDAMSKGMCMGLLSAYFDSMRLVYTCPGTEHVTREQLRDVVLKDLRNDPAQRHKSAWVLSMASYMTTFGCQKLK